MKEPDQRIRDIADIETLLSYSEGLTAWEVGFAENVRKSLDYHRSLTEDQRDKLDEILRRLEG